MIREADPDGRKNPRRKKSKKSEAKQLHCPLDQTSKKSEREKKDHSDNPDPGGAEQVGE